MKKGSGKGFCRFRLQVTPYDCSYIDRIERLESLLKRNPRAVQIDIVGTGEIGADSALLMRSVLAARSPKTHVTMNARSSLQGGTVLVWLMGDRRWIRDDAHVFFRPASEPDADDHDAWKKADDTGAGAPLGMSPEEGDYLRVLEVINEFLPVGEFAGRLIRVAVLRQFGLVENPAVDSFLAKIFARTKPSMPPGVMTAKPGVPSAPTVDPQKRD
jgi:hypothetical protein